MAVERETVSHVARLAHIALSPEEVEEFSIDLSSIVSHIDKLRELDTSHVELSAQASPVNNVLRDDTISPSWSVPRVLANAPRSADDLFEVQAILD